MTIAKTHYLHSRNGRIGGTGVDHGPADVDAIIAAIKSSSRKRLVMHFHGGLVSKAPAMGIAENLMPVYAAGGYPIFFVWESGPWETIRNNLADIAKESIFQELVRKLIEYTLGKVGAQAGTRSIAANAVDPDEVKARVRAFFSNPVTNPVPYADAHALLTQATRATEPMIEENAIQMDLEQDADFVRALQSIADVPTATRGALGIGDVARESTQMDAAALAEIAPAQRGATRGMLSMVNVSIRIAAVLTRIVKRFFAGRDHGFHATVVEEVLRAFYGDVIGKTFFWNQMKKDTQDAFGGDPNLHAGTALFSRLKSAMADDLSLERVYLIGHSTGCIYISHLLKAIDAMQFDPGLKFDIVFLAPANTHKLFAETLRNHSGRIRGFRMFAMDDQLEQDDGLLGDDWKRAFYPSSLLYFVSGLLEDEVDMPLVGMQRFHMNGKFAAPKYPESDASRGWLNHSAERTAWSIADHGDGRRTQSRKHGNFDNDPSTLASLKWIVSN